MMTYEVIEMSFNNIKNCLVKNWHESSHSHIKAILSTWILVEKMKKDDFSQSEPGHFKKILHESDPCVGSFKKYIEKKVSLINKGSIFFVFQSLSGRIKIYIICVNF